MIQAPYGAWPSPITAEMLTVGVLFFEDLVVEGDRVFWIELRPEENGRSVLMTLEGGEPKEVLDPSVSVRSRVHEYGGAALTVDGDEVFFVHATEHRIYRRTADGSVRPLTGESKLRFADISVDRARGRLVAICEDHTQSDLTPENLLVTIPLEGGEATPFVRGNDFYQGPRLSPDGTLVAWLTWNHPNLPWDDTELWVAQLDDEGTLGEPTLVVGGKDESVCHHAWSPGGVLHFVSDRSGWWNLYRWDGSAVIAVCAEEAEFGRPSYGLGGRPYSFMNEDEIVSVRTRCGLGGLVRIRDGEATALETGCTAVSVPRVVGPAVVFLGGSATEPVCVRRIDLEGGATSIVRPGAEVAIPDGFLAEPEVISFPTSDGATAHGFYYAPRNPGVTAADGERSPLVVFAHGGPVGATSTALLLGPMAILAPVYWTSRGYGVLDVNYRGSTGFGREYLRHLYGRWGVVDVDDCMDGAKSLAARGDVDGDRVIIRGGSAGGLTTMCAVTFREFFAAGGAYFGVSDLEAFHDQTHKFESRYDQQLIGDWDKQRERYRERSAVHFAHKAKTPCIVLQGLEDRIVPPNQSELFVEALRRAGVPVAYIEFEGEDHGFRRAENIKASLESEIYFYAKVLGLPVPYNAMPVEIDNLEPVEATR